jgi:hypothetical protein
MKILTEDYRGHFLVCQASRGAAGLFAGFRLLGAGELECVGYFLTEDAALKAGQAEGRRHVDLRLSEKPPSISWQPLSLAGLSPLPRP